MDRWWSVHDYAQKYGTEHEKKKTSHQGTIRLNVIIGGPHAKSGHTAMHSELKTYG
jgi:hypothetical protein